MEHQYLNISEEQQTIFSNKLSRAPPPPPPPQNPVYYKNCTGQTLFCHKINFTVNMSKQSTGTEMTNGS